MRKINRSARWVALAIGLSSMGCGGREHSLGDPNAKTDGGQSQLPSQQGDAGTGNTVSQGGPGALCERLPSTPTLITQLPGQPQPRALTAWGASLFVGIQYDNSDLNSPPKGAVIEIPMASREPVPIALPLEGYLSGPVLVDDAFIIFMKGVPSPTNSGWSISYPNILVYERKQQVLKATLNETPDGPQMGIHWLIRNTYTAQRVAHAPIFWSRYNGSGSSDLFAWDPENVIEHTVVQGGVLRPYANSAAIYWADLSRNQLMSLPLNQQTNVIGPPKPTGIGVDTTTPFVGVDPTTLYVFDQNSALRAWDFASGPSLRTVVADTRLDGLRPDWLASTFDDETHAYWPAYDADTGAVLRAKKDSSGGVEAIWKERVRFVRGVAVDLCNVYWTVTNPPAIYGRAK